MRGTHETAVQEAAETLSDRVSDQFKNVDVLGPSPAPYSRLRNQFRYQLLIKGADEAMGSCLTFLRGYRPAKAFMSVDVDPTDLL
jgi:primosomal protein N'